MVASGLLTTPFPEIRAPTGYGMYLIVNEASRDRAAVIELRNWLLEEFKRTPARQA